jgi:phosphoethanolamine N-methyltransferase
MASNDDGPALDDHQYTVAGLRSYEAIYGRDFVSPGGRRTTAEIFDELTWRPGQTVLDVGCGLGGAAFMMASDHAAQVLAIDLSRNMVDEAAKRCQSYGLSDQVTMVHGDILTHELPHQFDLIHSREVFLHIHDKAGLFGILRDSLKPGGTLLFTDYCCGPDQPSEAFQSYVTEFGYDLRTVDEIGTLLTDAGFGGVSATDQTQRFIDIHHRELEELANTDLSQSDQDELRVGWLSKIDRAERGEQRWGWFQATV